MAEEIPQPVPRGLTLEQAEFIGFQRREEEILTRLDRVTATLERIALPAAPPPRQAPPAPRRNAQLARAMFEEEDNLSEEDEEPVQQDRKSVV